MKLSDLQRVTEGKITRDAEFFGLSQALDQVKSGDLFVCLKGMRFDAHDHAQEAVSAGAVALAVERELPIDVPQVIVADTREALSRIAVCFYGLDKPAFTLVGVTGTNGKTSIAYMLRRIFSAAGKSARWAWLRTNSFCRPP